MQEQTKNNQNIAWLPSHIIEQLLSAATHEYETETYDINSVARVTIMKLGKSQTPQQQQKQNINKKMNYQQQIIYFCSLLGGTPRYFIELLNQQVLTTQSQIITINSKNSIIIQRLFSDFQIFSNQLGIIPAYSTFVEINKAVYTYLNTVARKICKLYEQCCGMLNKEMQLLTDKVKTSKMMNNFLLYKIFRQISDFAKILVEDKSTESVFRHCHKEVIEQFFRYIINKFQIINFNTNEDFEQHPQPLCENKFIENIEQNEYVEFTAKQAINSQGKFAIFLKTYAEYLAQKNKMEDYLLLLNDEGQLQIINCKTLRKKWYIIGPVNNNFKLSVISPLTSNFKLSKYSKQYLIEGQIHVDHQRQNKKETIQALFKGEPIDNYTNTNGVVGRCLFLMRQYNGVSDFFKDISKRALLSRSIDQISRTVPIVGYMILAGTFSANFYKIFSNRFSNGQRKLKELGGLFINTGATVGTSILGAIAGQILIPIPIFGALIGTVIGGYLGDKGGKKINSFIETKRFAQIIEYLKKTQINQRYWMYTKELNRLLQIKESSFQKYKPGHMQEQVFATLICFVLVCFYESKRLNKYNLEKIQNMGTLQTNPNINQGAKGQDQFQEEVLRLNMDQNYETEFNMPAMIDYLQQNSAPIYQHYSLLEKSILTFLTKIN